jgi:hypothetical protein
MLIFNPNHQSINKDINKMRGRRALKRISILGLIISKLFTFSGCSKKMPCGINDSHAHYYVSTENNFGRYIASERKYVSGLKRTENYTIITEEDKKTLKLINDNDLYRIDENQQAINAFVENLQPHTEYEYEYDEILLLPLGDSYMYYIDTKKSWTTDTSKKLTGKTREVDYVLYGCKIVREEDGSYSIQKSQPVKDLSELPDGYNYITEEFYIPVDFNDNSIVLEYGDSQDKNKSIEYMNNTIEEDSNKVL